MLRYALPLGGLLLACVGCVPIAPFGGPYWSSPSYYGGPYSGPYTYSYPYYGYPSYYGSSYYGPSYYGPSVGLGFGFHVH